MADSHPQAAASLPRRLLLDLWGYGSLLLWSLVGMVLFPVAFLVGRAVTRQPGDVVMRKLVWLFGRIWLALLSPCWTIRREVVGAPPPRPCIFVCNHFSALDAYFMSLVPFADIAFVIRAWPFRIPLYAWFMRLARYVDTERLGWKGAEEAEAALLARGCSPLFFPEGHRSRDGRIGRFYSGAFRLSVETGVPIVPLVLTGTRELLPPGRRHLGPARIRLAVLPPVFPEGHAGPLAHLRLREQVKGQIVRHLGGGGEVGAPLPAEPEPALHP